MTRYEIDIDTTLQAVAEFQIENEFERTVVESVLKALTESKNLVVLYTDASGRQTQRIVEPQGLKRSKADDLNVTCWDLGKNAYRSFRADRMNVLGLLPKGV